MRPSAAATVLPVLIRGIGTGPGLHQGFFRVFAKLLDGGSMLLCCAHIETGDPRNTSSPFPAAPKPTVNMYARSRVRYSGTPKVQDARTVRQRHHCPVPHVAAWLVAGANCLCWTEAGVRGLGYVRGVCTDCRPIYNLLAFLLERSAAPRKPYVGTNWRPTTCADTESLLPMPNHARDVYLGE